ncbi:hypothetical protein BKA93DRAFT_750756 [Sparassis latifolia]
MAHPPQCTFLCIHLGQYIRSTELIPSPYVKEQPSEGGAREGACSTHKVDGGPGELSEGGARLAKHPRSTTKNKAPTVEAGASIVFPGMRTCQGGHMFNARAPAVEAGASIMFPGTSSCQGGWWGWRGELGRWLPMGFKDGRGGA